jgi:hypothetical protein
MCCDGTLAGKFRLRTWLGLMLGNLLEQLIAALIDRKACGGMEFEGWHSDSLAKAMECGSSKCSFIPHAGWDIAGWFVEMRHPNSMRPGIAKK